MEKEREIRIPLLDTSADDFHEWMELVEEAAYNFDFNVATEIFQSTPPNTSDWKPDRKDKYRQSMMRVVTQVFKMHMTESAHAKVKNSPGYSREAERDGTLYWALIVGIWSQATTGAAAVARMEAQITALQIGPGEDLDMFVVRGNKLRRKAEAAGDIYTDSRWMGNFTKAIEQSKWEPLLDKFQEVLVDAGEKMVTSDQAAKWFKDRAHLLKDVETAMAVTQQRQDRTRPRGETTGITAPTDNNPFEGGCKKCKAKGAYIWFTHNSDEHMEGNINPQDLAKRDNARRERGAYVPKRSKTTSSGGGGTGKNSGSKGSGEGAMSKKDFSALVAAQLPKIVNNVVKHLRNEPIKKKHKSEEEEDSE
jgi:hypothetical protein